MIYHLIDNLWSHGPLLRGRNPSACVPAVSSGVQYAERIGDRLRRMRESAGYSQQELGWYVAKGYSIISRYENGKALLSASDIPILTARCNRTPAYLFQFEDTQIHEECRAVQEAIRYIEKIQTTDYSSVQSIF